MILEDDCQIDTKELNKINLNKLPQDKMIYFGGTLRSMTFKTKGWDLNKTRKSLNCDNKKSTLNTSFQVNSKNRWSTLLLLPYVEKR